MADNREKKVSKYPAGSYQGVIVDQGFSKVGKENKPAFEVTVTMNKRLDPKTNQYDVIPEPITTKVTLFLTEASIEKFDVVEKIRECGYTGNDLRELDPNYAGHVSLKGNVVNLRHTGFQYEWHIATKGGGKAYKIDNNSEVALQAAKAFNRCFGDVPAAAGGSTNAPVTPPNDNQLPF